MSSPAPAIFLTSYYALLSSLHFSGHLPSSHPPSHPKRPFLLHEALCAPFLLSLALCLPWNRKLVAAVFLPLLAECYYNLLGTGSPSAAIGYFIGSFVAFHSYQTLDLLVFSNPRKNYRRLPSPSLVVKKREEESYKDEARGQEEEGEGYPLDNGWRRLGWVAELTLTCRGVGWNWRVRIPQDSHTGSRGTWVLKRVLHMLAIWVWVDLLVYYMRTLDRPFFLPPGHATGMYPCEGDLPYPTLFSSFTKSHIDVPAPLGFPPLPAEDGWERTLYQAALHTMRILLSASALLAAIDGAFVAATVLFVLPSLLILPTSSIQRGALARWFSPQAWPPAFGSWGRGDFRSVRRFWGRGWHGLFRHVFTSPVVFALSQMPSGGAWDTARFLIMAVTPFAMSAGLHWAGCYTQSFAGWGAVRFFMAQPIGILLETLVASAWTKVVGRERGRVLAVLEGAVAYSWTFVWFVVSSDSFFQEYRWGGLWAAEPVPGSFIKAYVHGPSEFWRWPNGVNGRSWWRWASKEEGGLAGEWGVVL